MECYIVYRNNYLCICGRNIKYAKMYHVNLYIYTITEVLFFFHIYFYEKSSIASNTFFHTMRFMYMSKSQVLFVLCCISRCMFIYI